MKSLLFNLFILFSISIHAQNWSPSGANWTYSYYGFFPGYVDVLYSGDTIIDGQTSKMLTKTFHGIDWNMTLVSNVFAKDYTYENNGVVYIRYQNQWDTLYHFNAQVGDHWRMAKQPVANVCPQNSRLNVLATGNKLINNETRKYLVVDFCNPDLSSLGWGQDTIVENIGFIGSYFLPYDQFDGALDANEGGPFRCYTDDNFATYAPHYNGACDYIVGMEELSGSSSFIIYPNPIQNDIHIPFDFINKFTRYTLYSLDGKIHQMGYISENIPVHHLKSGNYLLEISNESEKKFAKILKLD
jgi:hypothetical protein